MKHNFTLVVVAIVLVSVLPVLYEVRCYVSLFMYVCSERGARKWLPRSTLTVCFLPLVTRYSLLGERLLLRRRVGKM